MATLAERVGEKLNLLNVKLRDVQFLSGEYDDPRSLRKVVEAALKQIKENLKTVADKVDNLEAAIDAMERYSYHYTLIIVGLPQTSVRETAEATAILCLKVFQAMGVEGISL